MSENRQIESYIRQNRSMYTRRAIADHLVAMGYSKEEIERVWESMASQSNPQPQGSRKLLGKAIDLGIVGWIVVSEAGLFWFASVVDGSMNHAINILFIVTEIGAMIGAGLLLWRGVRLWQVAILLTAMNFVWLVVIWGNCISSLRGTDWKLGPHL